MKSVSLTYIFVSSLSKGYDNWGSNQIQGRFQEKRTARREPCGIYLCLHTSLL